jgi:hypothetical protein
MEAGFQNRVNNREKRRYRDCSPGRLFQDTAHSQQRTNTLRASRVLGDFSIRHNPMKVRVLRVPPSRALEGIDLRPYQLQEGSVYDLEPRVAQVLIMWKYAERVPRRGSHKKPKK